MGDAILGRKLYVRNDYLLLWEHLKEAISSGIRGVVISGTPGIGKSRFGLFLLSQLAQTKSVGTIVWEATQSRRRFLFRRGVAAVKGDLGSFACELDNPIVWCEDLFCFVSSPLMLMA